MQLSQAEGIEEVVALATSNRTEFLMWVSAVTLAANSVMRLGSEYGLKLCEWIELGLGTPLHCDSRFNIVN